MCGNIIKDVKKNLIKISQDEAKYLRENGRESDIHMASQCHKGRAKTYYLTTSYKSMKLLEKYRTSRITKTFGG